MRTKAHRYGAVVTGTFTNLTDVVGVTGDFEGGMVLASAIVAATPGVGQYITVAFAVDGAVQSQAMGGWQSGGSLQVAFTWLLRVPQGRHRISVRFGTSVAPIASSTAELSVAELNA
jgi:hypothetical protein